MDVVHPRCAGLDVHKQTIVACVLCSEPRGGVERQTRTFGTMTADLQALVTWLKEHGVTHVVMEATGAYWKPPYNVLEADGGFELLVGNAEHLRAVPGRKTDVKDAEWLATLLRHGLVRASFIPDRFQRELRELTRYRTALIRERGDEVNRLQKTLEGASLKLASVLTDVSGVSGQRILAALLAGETDPEHLVEVAHGRVKHAKRAQLEAAVVGQLSDVLRCVVDQQVRHIRQLDEQIAACDAQVAQQLRPFLPELTRLRTIPGVGRRTAEVILAEVGLAVERFPTARHLAAWAGMCPGNRQSGGKRQPARTRQGSPWLRAALAEAAWTAGRDHHGYLSAHYRRLVARRGKKRAIVAVGHSLLVIAYHLLTRGTTYADLGETWYDERDRQAVCKRTVKRLEALGYRVHLDPLPQAA